MPYIPFLLLAGLAVAAEAAHHAPKATPAVCSSLNSCYSRYSESSTASAYCSSFMSVVPTTTHVTVTTTAAASTQLVTHIVTKRGTTTLLQTSTADVGAAYVTSYLSCSTAKVHHPLSSAVEASSVPAKRSASAAPSSSITAPACIEYLVAEGAAATSSACKCIVVTPTNTVSVTNTVTPKPSTYTWTGTISLESTVRHVTTVTLTPTYTVTMDPLPCSLTTLTSSVPSTSTSVATSEPLTLSTPSTFTSTAPSTSLPSAVGSTLPTVGTPPPFSSPVTTPSSTSSPASGPTNLIVDPSFELVPSSALYQPGSAFVENWETVSNAYFGNSSSATGEPNFNTSWGNQFAVLGDYSDPIGTAGAAGGLVYTALANLDPTQTYTLAFEQAIHFDQPATGEFCYFAVQFLADPSGQMLINKLSLFPGTPVYTNFLPVSYTFTPPSTSGSLEWYNYCDGSDYSGRFFVAIDMVSLTQGVSTPNATTATSSPTTLSTVTTPSSTPGAITPTTSPATLSTVTTPSSNLYPTTATSSPTTLSTGTPQSLNAAIPTPLTAITSASIYPSQRVGAIVPAPPLCNNQGLQFEIFTDVPSNNFGPTYANVSNYISQMPQTVPQLTGITSTMGGLAFEPNDNEQITIYNVTTPFDAANWYINQQGYIFAPYTGFYTFVVQDVEDFLAVWVGPNAAEGSSLYDTSCLGGSDVPADNEVPDGSCIYNMTAGEYYPFRAIYAKGAGGGGGGYWMEITNPDGSVLTTSSEEGNPYIVSYSCDGTSAPPLPAWPSASNSTSTATTATASPTTLTTVTTLSSTPAATTQTPSPSQPVGGIFPAPPLCNNQGLQWELFTDLAPSIFDGWTPFGDYISEMPQVVPQLTGITSTISGFSFEYGSTGLITIYNVTTPFGAGDWAINHQGYILAPYTGTYTFAVHGAEDFLSLWIGQNAVTGWSTSNTNCLASTGASNANCIYNMTAGEYYPFRAIYGKNNNGGGGGYWLQIDNPDGSTLTTSFDEGNPYIVSYSCDGTSAPPLPAWASASNSTSSPSVLNAPTSTPSVTNAPTSPTTLATVTTQASTPGAVTPTSSAASLPTVTSTPPPLDFPAPAMCNNQGLQWEMFTDMGTYYHGPTWYQFEDYISQMPKMVPQLSGITSTIGGFSFEPNENDQTTIYNVTTPFDAEHWSINQQGYILAPQTGEYNFQLGGVDDYLAVWVGPDAAAGWTTSNLNGLTDIILPPANFTYFMTAGQYYPFRSIYANSYGGGGYFMYIVNPDGTNLTTSAEEGNPYIVSYSCDGTSAPALRAWAGASNSTGNVRRTSVNFRANKPTSTLAWRDVLRRFLGTR